MRYYFCRFHLSTTRVFFRVVIVPTAAVGAGSFMGSSLKIVIFDLPKRSELSGIIGGENTQATQVEPVIEKVFNGEEFLGALGKHVVKFDAAEFTSNVKARNEVEPLYTRYGRGKSRLSYTKRIAHHRQESYTSYQRASFVAGTTFRYTFHMNQSSVSVST